jgi:hypothetical protein
MAEGKVKVFRFTDEELALLEAIQGHTGIRSRMEALRTVMEYYAKAEGVRTHTREQADASSSFEANGRPPSPKRRS